MVVAGPLLWLLGCQAFSTLAAMLLLPVMPLYVATLAGTTPVDAAHWSAAALAAPALGTLLLGPLAGRCCDRFGPRALASGGCLVFAAGLALTATLDHAAALLLGRLLQGASVLSVGITAAVIESAGRFAGRALARLESATAAGSLGGPLLGGLSLQAGNMRPLLGLAAVLMAGMAWGLWRSIPPRPARAPITPPLVMPWRWRGRSRRWLLSILLVQTAAFGLAGAFVLFLAERYAALPLLAVWAGVLHAGAWGATLIATPCWGRCNRLASASPLFRLGACSTALCLLALTMAQPLWSAVLWRILLGASYAALMQSALLALVSTSSLRCRGQLVGSSRSVAAFGQLLGPLLLVTLTPHVSASWVLVVIALLFVAAGALSPWRRWSPPADGARHRRSVTP
ncbi:MAG TPA: MFS transporter [Stenotrophomonas sp.]|nr:MFS transporter [Stenotrophomonas sp.]